MRLNALHPAPATASESDSSAPDRQALRVVLSEEVDDHGDNRESATALALGVAIDARISTGIDQDWFKVDLLAGQRYLFEMTPEADLNQAALTVYDGAGNFLSMASGADLASLSLVTGAAGSYYLSARELTSNDTGGYRVRVSAVTGADDHGDNADAASTLVLGARSSGQIEVVGDEDWFKLDLQAGQRYLFEMDASGAGSLGTAQLQLLSPQRGYLVLDSDADLASFSHIAQSSGTYYLRAAELNHASSGSYGLRVSAAVTQDDHGDTLESASSLALGTPLDAQLELVSDVDWFRLDLQAGQRYEFRLDSSAGGAIDVGLLSLRDAGGRLLSQLSGADSALLTWSATVDGTHYLRISDLNDGSSGSYRLSATLLGSADDHGDAPETASALTLGEAAAGQLETSTDQDWFRVEVTAGVQYRFEMVAGSELGDAALSLFSDEGDELAFESGADGAGFAYAATYSGSVYLQAVELNNASTGGYTVTASVVPNDPTEGDDLLLGDAGANALAGLGGNDTLLGGGGDDTLDGGSGIDSMEGGAGDDLYRVDNAGDQVVELADGGSDTVQVDRTHTLAANVENGILDTAAAASLYGNALDNVLVAGAGNNTLYGAGGTDTASYVNAGGAVTVSLAIAEAQATGGSGSDRLVLIENLTGSAYADRLTGNAGWNVLDGGAGADTLDGGEGSDTYVIDNVGDVILDSGGAADWVWFSTASFSLVSGLENGRILGSGAATVYGNGANNILIAGAGNNTLYGAGGTDTASYQFAAAAVQVDLSRSDAQDTGGSGLDRLLLIENLTGSSHADTLKGSITWNWIDGGLGADTMEGGLGSDTYVVDDAGDVVIEAALGGISDWVYSRLASFTLGEFIENGAVDVAGSADLTGNALANVLLSGLGDNRLDGQAGIDTVSFQRAVASVRASLVSGSASGGAGNDSLVGIESLWGSSFADQLDGDAAANVIRGGGGADRLNGGAGADLLYGGFTAAADGAADTFVFDTALGGGNVDRLLGFEASGLDQIELHASIFSAIGATLDAGEFRLGTTALDADDFILFDSRTGNLYYDADGNGSGAAVLFARLSGVIGALDAGDFVVGPPPGPTPG